MISSLSENVGSSVTLAPSAQDASAASVDTVIFFAIPQADHDAFARLPDKLRQHTTTTLLLLQRIHDARGKSKSAEAKAIAFERIGQRGFSQESLLRKYYRFIQTNNWRDILDRAMAGPEHWNTEADAGLPAAFLEFWKSLCERNQRCTAPARRELIRIWETGRGLCPVTSKTKTYPKFPGYPDWAPMGVGKTPVPSGWSVANLNRHAPSKFELAVARQGRESGAQHRRKVFTTRHGLAVGQFYLFDDLVYDHLVNFPGNPRATRPLGLVALDLYSACAVGIGFKPTLQDEDGTKRKLKERDMLWLVVDVLCNKGFRADDRGTSLVVENGTAAIRPDFAERIFKATAGKVTVDRAGLSSMHMPGLFEGASKGNPRFKAALESLFNLVHNEGGALPAATGKDRQHAPTQLAGIERYNTHLLKLARGLPQHRRDLLQYPVLNYYDFVQLTLDIYARINARTEHELEGWQKCRHFVQEFFLDMGCNVTLPPSAEDQVGTVPARQGPPRGPSESGMWLTHDQWLAMDAAKRQALKPFVQARSRNLSPIEVWQRDAATQLQRLGECMLPTLLGPDFGEERHVRGGYITIEDRELDSDPIRFPVGAHCQDGAKFLTYLSPHHPDRLILTNAKGSYLGTLQRQYTPTRADRDAVLREQGQARHEESQRLINVTTRAMPVAEANRDLHRNNYAVVNGQPVTHEELQSAADLRARVKKVNASDVDAVVGPVAPRGPLGDAGSNVTFAPSAQDAPAASGLDSDLNDLL